MSRDQLQHVTLLPGQIIFGNDSTLVPLCFHYHGQLIFQTAAKPVPFFMLQCLGQLPVGGVVMLQVALFSILRKMRKINHVLCQLYINNGI